MSNRTRPVLLASALLLLFSFARAQDLASVDIPYEKHVLDNGLTVILHEDHTAPLVYVNVYYKVGSRDEVPGKSGFAHLFEHLMFNGSENYDDEFFKPIQEVGGSANGDTSFDRTRYYQTVPSTALERILWLEAERMGHLLGAVTQEKLDQQRGVVQNEKRRSDNRPYAGVYPATLEYLFPEGHPYSWPVIGSMEDLDAASLEDVYAWFETYYGAANAILTIAGDIDPEEALQMARLQFGDIPPGPPVAQLDDWVPTRLESTYQLIEDRVANDVIFRAWVAPGRDLEESTPLALAADILGGDASSRLHRRLVKEEQLAVAVSMSLQPLDLASIVRMQIVLAPGADPHEARRIADEEIARFAAEGPTATELELIKVQIAGLYIKNLDSLSGKAVLLAESDYYLGSPDAYKTEFAWVENTTVESLRDSVATWLGDNYHEIFVTEFGDFTVADTGADRSELPAVDSYPPAIAPEIQDFELDNGIKVRFVQREGVPAVSLNGQFRVGSYTSADETPAAAGIALAALTRGTTSRSADDIIADMKLTGSSISVTLGDDRSNASLSTLTSRFDEAVALFADILRNPSFDPAEVKILKDQVIAGIGQGKTNPQRVVRMYIDATLYGDHPYGEPPATIADVESLTIDDLRAAWKRRIRPEDLTLFVVGGIDENDMLAALNAYLGSWKPDGGPSAVVDVTTQPDKVPPRVIIFDMPGAPQSNIFAATVIDPPYQPGDDAFTFANMIYGGNFTSRINTLLREEKGWSYGVSSNARMWLGPRTWYIFAQVQTDKTAASIADLLAELQALETERPFTIDELNDVRNERIRQLPAATATSQGILSYMVGNDLYGRPDDYLENRKADYEAVKLEDLEVELQRRVDPQDLVWFIAGDLSQIEEDIKSLDLGETEVWDVDGNRVR